MDCRDYEVVRKECGAIVSAVTDSTRDLDERIVDVEGQLARIASALEALLEVAENTQ